MYLFGASGHAKVIIEIAEILELKIFGLFDDNEKITKLLDYSVNHSDSISNYFNHMFLISIGSNSIRKNVTKRFNMIYCGALIHPSASISRRSNLGEGTVVMSNVTVNSNSKIGNHSIVNTAASIDHDCILEDFTHISPNVALAGGVSVGEGTHIGIGASVIPNIKIGSWAIIGAGAVIINDVPDNSVVVGNPGRIIKYNK